MPWIPSTTIASSAGVSAKTYKNMNNKSNKIVWLVAFLVSVLLISLFTRNAHAEAVYDANIALRELKSLTYQLPKYKIEKTFQITHTDGTPLMFNVTKFECCNAPIAMVKDGQLYFDYYNTGKVVPLGATNTDVKVDVPEFHMETILHELCHHVTIKHTGITDNKIQEKMCYDFEHLYTQIKSHEEDGRFILIK